MIVFCQAQGQRLCPHMATIWPIALILMEVTMHEHVYTDAAFAMSTTTRGRTRADAGTYVMLNVAYSRRASRCRSCSLCSTGQLPALSSIVRRIEPLWAEILVILPET